MVISQLLQDLTPDEQYTWTLEQLQKEIEGFDFQGPGWYHKDGTWMLVIGTNTPGTYIFHVFFDRDPRIGYKALALAPVHMNAATTATVSKVKVAQPVNYNRAIYWGGVLFLWIVAWIIGYKWGFKAEIPVLFIMIMWPTAIRRWFRKTEEKTNAKL
jgi:hypothetical protein